MVTGKVAHAGHNEHNTARGGGKECTERIAKVSPKKIGRRNIQISNFNFGVCRIDERANLKVYV